VSALGGARGLQRVVREVDRSGDFGVVDLGGGLRIERERRWGWRGGGWREGGADRFGDVVAA
jgi:hypothetical protein